MYKLTNQLISLTCLLPNFTVSVQFCNNVYDLSHVATGTKAALIETHGKTAKSVLSRVLDDPSL